MRGWGHLGKGERVDCDTMACASTSGARSSKWLIWAVLISALVGQIEADLGGCSQIGFIILKNRCRRQSRGRHTLLHTPPHPARTKGHGRVGKHSGCSVQYPSAKFQYKCSYYLLCFTACSLRPSQPATSSRRGHGVWLQQPTISH